MDPDILIEMNYCRRCGTPLTHGGGRLYQCEQGHDIYTESTASAGIILLNDQDEVLLLQRNIEPHRGTYNIPGGICDLVEGPLHAAIREVEEETGITADQYTAPQFVQAEVEPYPFRDEVLASLPTVFTARLKGPVVPKLDHESLSASFIALRELDLDTIRFSGIREALRKVRESLDIQA
jgi:8-oxo-dGTP diphosphatase